MAPAGDPRAFPQHIADGLSPWSAAKFYLPAWSGAGEAYDDSEPPPHATLAFDVGTLDAATGVSYARIGEWSRRFHRTQRMGQWLDARPMPRPLHLAASRVGTGTERAITDGIPADLAAWADAVPEVATPLRAAHAAIGDAQANLRDRASLGPPLAHARTHIISTLDTCASRMTPPGLVRALKHKLQDLDKALAAIVASEMPLKTTPRPDRNRGPDISVHATDIVFNRTHPGRKWAVRLDTPAEIAADRFSMRAVPGIVMRVEQTDKSASGRTRQRLILDADAAVSSTRIETDILLDGAPFHAVSRAAYPHTGEVTRTFPARIRIQPVEVHIAPGTRVAYLGGGFDRIDRWLDAIGIETVSLDDDRLADADLANVSTVVVGIQAFGTRADLRRGLTKLHAFVRAGGHLVTFYHRPVDGWSGVPLARITIGTPSVRWRTTRADAPVMHLEPHHGLLTKPNVITAADWSGWAKERGLYFASAWDGVYQPLLAMSDPDEAPLHGALLSGTFGNGRHTHCALALHTQLDALVPGAFRLLANLAQGAR